MGILGIGDPVATGAIAKEADIKKQDGAEFEGAVGEAMSQEAEGGYETIE